MSDEYRIETMADMLKVPEDKWPEMLIDLEAWLRLMTSHNFVVEVESGESFPVAMQPTFIWIDDGLRDVQRLYVGEDRFDRNEDFFIVTPKGRAMLKDGE